MRNIHYFENQSDFEEYRENKYSEPWVSYTEGEERVDYNKSEHEKLLEMPLTTIAKENGTISFNIWKSMGTDMITSVSYSTDSGETWTTTNNTNNKAENLAITVNVNEGDRVMWKANAQQTGFYDEDGYGVNVGSFFSSTCEFDVEGNVMSMINDATGLTYSGQLSCLFSNFDYQTECLVVDASKLLLPATTLTQNCYDSMFANCTSLTQAPELPATTLAVNCYYGMFMICTSLTTAPALPATTLAVNCYYGMFMGCTSLTTAPALPATTLAVDCYRNMFYSCTSLTQAPELPATTLANSCYYWMFNYCSNLNYIKCLATDISASYCTSEWVNGVAASGTFVTPSTTAWSTGNNGIPTNWTRVNA